MPVQKSGLFTWASRKIPSVEFSRSQSKKAILALLSVSNSYLFQTAAAYPYTAGYRRARRTNRSAHDLTLKQVEFLFHLFPLIRIGRGLFDLADRGPFFRKLRV